MSGKKISDTKSVNQALSVCANFSDHILGPAVKHPKHWDMKNIVLFPITLVFGVSCILTAVPTYICFYLEERPDCDANGPDWDNRNLNFSIKNNAGVILGALVTVIALIFIMTWNVIFKPIVKSCNKIVAKNEELDSQCPWGGDVNQLRYEVGPSLCILPDALKELERRKQDTDNPLAVEGSSLFGSNLHPNENDSLLLNDAEGRELANIPPVNC